MPIICWGNLAKSADDVIRIEQAIEDYVSGHQQDPNAHMATEYSLGAHRQVEELDHVDGSVGMRKLPINKIVGVSCFESIENWSLHGETSGGINNTSIKTNPPDDWARLYTPFPAAPVKLDFSKNPFFQTTVVFMQDTAQEAYIVAGAEPSAAKDDSFGFYIHDALLYAYWTKGGAQYTEQITGITITDLNVYRAFYDTTAEKLYFYVNGVLEYTAEANLPTDTNDKTFSYYLFSDVGADLRQMYMIDFLFEIDR